MTFEEQYARYREIVENDLAAAFPTEELLPGPGRIPLCLGEAMRYSLLAGGKRFRPILLLAAYQMIEEDFEPARPFAAATEMIHTYSLIHDDLPAMDNDDLRRGKPTCHVVYGQAIAILAGDALLNLAYELMICSGNPRTIAAMREIAVRAGPSGMVAGQALDIALTGRVFEQSHVDYIHAHKTADLITAPVVAGLVLAGASSSQVQSGRDFGYHLGRAFQIVDDLLDISGNEASLGKHPGKDEARRKPTWPAQVGEAAARRDAGLHTSQAISALSPFAEKSGFLALLAQRALNRLQ
jgi:geranylgeranyl diphosphate synthase, type II